MILPYTISLVLALAQPPDPVNDAPPVTSGASAAGDLGFTVGEAEITGKGPDGAPRTSYPKYLTIWRRQADGSYLYETDSGNARPAPPIH